MSDGFSVMCFECGRHVPSTQVVHATTRVATVNIFGIKEIIKQPVFNCKKCGAKKR